MEQPTITRGARPRKVTMNPPAEVLGFDLDNTEVVEIAPGVFEVPDEEEGSVVEEKPPRIPTPTLSEHVEGARERLRSLGERVRNPRKATPAKGGVKRPRTPVAGLISAVWGLGSRVFMNPATYPVANMLAIQSPIAGEILEDVVKNTVVDTVLQPFARAFKGGDTAWALLGPPILVGVACARQESEPFIRPLLREALKSWTKVASPKAIERAKEEKEWEEEYGVTIDAMINMIFSPPPGMVVDGTSEQADTTMGPNHRGEYAAR